MGTDDGPRRFGGSPPPPEEDLFRTADPRAYAGVPAQVSSHRDWVDVDSAIVEEDELDRSDVAGLPEYEVTGSAPDVDDTLVRRRGEPADKQPVTGNTGRTNPVLQVEGLDIDFWVDGTWYPAVIGATFQLDPGEVLAIVGESGSGKSTIAMSLMGLLPANAHVSGSIKLGARQIVGAAPNVLRHLRGEEIAVIFQEPMTALNPVYTIGFQIGEMLRTHSAMSPKSARARAIELLKMVEIPEPERRVDSYPHQLSGGQRQRAMIAQSLACDPKLLLADEPTTALDVTVQAEILKLMRDLKDRIDASDHPDHPRHGRGGRPLRPHPGDEGRPDGGVGPVVGDLPAPDAPVHDPTAKRGSPPRRRGGRAGRARRRAPG